jgi:hypothetical protein
MGTYAIQSLDRATRTALQVLTGYLATAHTVGGVDWRAAFLATVLAFVVSLTHAAVTLPAVPVLGVWGDVVGRAIRTAAQTALSSAGANVILLTDVPWGTVLTAAGLAAVSSLVTSVVSLPLGPEAVKGTPNLV